jgi:hypothetical protein
LGLTRSSEPLRQPPLFPRASGSHPPGETSSPAAASGDNRRRQLVAGVKI